MNKRKRLIKKISKIYYDLSDPGGDVCDHDELFNRIANYIQDFYVEKRIWKLSDLPINLLII